MTASRGRIVIINWRDGAHPLAGGAELYCERVCEELGRSGEDVILLTSRPGALPAREDRGTYRVVRAGGTYTVYAHVLLWLLVHRSTISAVVDSQNGIPFFSPVALSRRTPVLLLLHHVHQHQFDQYFGPRAARVGKWLEGPVSRWVYGRRSVVAVSPSTRADVRRQLRLRGAISVVPCGMDTPTVQGRRAALPRIVVVGRLVPHKRLDLLIDALPEVARVHPGVELHLVGDGPARSALESRAERSPASPNITFHGRLSEQDRDEVLASAWLTASASAGEGWGLSVIEANAAGIPAVAFRVSGLSDSIRHGRTGWLVEPGGSLATAVCDAISVLADPEGHRAFSRAARAWAGHFSWERTALGLRLTLDLERRRLSLHQGERRSANDVVSIVDIPRDLLEPTWHQRRRLGDTWTSTESMVRGLLHGADETDVARVLARLHVDPADPSVQVTMARPVDLLGEPASWAPPSDDRRHVPHITANT